MESKAPMAKTTVYQKRSLVNKKIFLTNLMDKFGSIPPNIEFKHKSSL